MRRTALTCLLLLLPSTLLAPPAASAETESWGGSLRGPSVGADAQVLQGPLVAGVVYVGNNAPAPLPWTLEGASVEVYTEVEVRQDPNAPPETDPENPRRVLDGNHSVEYGAHGEFTALVNRSISRYVYLFPHADGAVLERTIGAVELVASDRETVWSHEESSPQNERETGQDVRNTTWVQDVDSALRYVVRGDFLVDVVGIDWLVRDADGETLYRSGQTSGAPDPNDPTAFEPEVDPDGPFPARQEERTVHLFVRDGTLTIPGSGHLQFDWFLDDGVAVQSEGAVLRAATGTVHSGANGVVLAGDDLEFRGRVDLSGVRAEDGILHYEVSSGAPSVFVAGDRFEASARTEPAPPPASGSEPVEGASPETVATVTTDPAPDSGVGAWWLLLFLLPLGVLLVRPPFWLVAASVRAGLHGFAARHAPRFLPGRHGPSAAVLGAVALLGRSRYDDAVRFLGNLAADVRPAPATWHYLQAHGRAGLGEDDVAADHLDACIGLAPEYSEEVLGNPVLRRVVDADPARFHVVLANAGRTH